MKIALLVACSLISFSSFANCKKKIDDSKVMLFIDTNDSDLEIDVAQKAACERGQKLLVVPNNYKSYAPTIKEINVATTAVNRCVKNNATALEKCSAFGDALTRAHQKHANFLQGQAPLQTQIKSELEKIRRDGQSIENVTFSGHDGGGQFGGTKGSIGRTEVLQLMQDYKDINKAKSVMLLGCYTGVPNEIIGWQVAFPEARFIGGYDGSAPLSFRPEGHTYYYDLLTKEKDLIASADQKKIQSVLSANFKDMRLLNAAMYVKPECQNVAEEDEKAYYYNTLGKNKGLSVFEASSCQKEAAHIAEVREKLNKYFTGELEPPKETSRGELRNLYNQARSLEHCQEFGPELAINAPMAFGLLFHEGFKKNLANFYEKDFDKIQKILNDVTAEDIQKIKDENLAMIQKNIDLSNENLKKIEEFKQNPEAYIAKEEAELKEQEAKFNEWLKNNPINEANMPQMSMVLDPNMLTSVQKLFMEKQQMQMELELKKSMLNSMKKYPTEYASHTENGIRSFLNFSSAQKESLEASTLSPEDIKKIWVPNKKNVDTISRKEIMDNIHQASKLLSSPLLPPKAQQALSWSTSATSSVLLGFGAPFSWHEYTGTTENLPHYTPFQENGNNPFMHGPGMGFGGYGTGSYGNGGIGVGIGAGGFGGRIL